MASAAGAVLCQGQRAKWQHSQNRSGPVELQTLTTPQPSQCLSSFPSCVHCRHMAKAVEGAVERVSVADCQRTNKRCMHEKMLKSTLCSVNARWCTRTVTHLGMCSLAREANACRIYVCNCILCSASVALAATSVCGLFISCQRQASPHPPTRVTDERVTKKKRTNATVQRSAQRA